MSKQPTNLIDKSLPTNVKKRACVLVLALTALLSACTGQEKTAEDYLNEGLAQAKNSQLSQALIAYKNAAQLAPRSSKIRFELGKTQLALNNFAEASKDLTLALENRYAEEEIIPMLALALARSNANVALVDLSYNSELLSEEEQVEVGVRRIAAMLALNQTDEASALAQSLESINIDTVYKGLLTAYQFILSGQDSEALNTLDVLLETTPNNRDLNRLAASLYVIDGNVDTAISLYDNYVALAQDDLEAKFILINLLIQQDDAQRAEKYIDELLTTNTNSGMLNQLKAIARSQNDDHYGAKVFAEKAINGGRSDDRLRLIAGLSAHKIKEYESAIKHLSIIEATLPKGHVALQALTDSKLQLDLVKDAEALLSRINETEEDTLGVFPRTSYQLIKSGDTAAASAIIEQNSALAVTPQALLSQGALKLSLNNLTGVADLERALLIAPDSYTAKNTLAGAYILTKQFNKALNLARQWQVDEPEIVEGYLLEADVMSMQAKNNEARALVDKAINIDPKNTFARLASIQLDMTLQEYDGGLIKVQALLEDEPNNPKALASHYKIQSELGNADDINEAIDMIRNAANNLPDDEDLTILYASILVSTGNFADAVTVLNRIEANRFTLSTYWRLRGLALYELSSTKALEEHYRLWVNLFPEEVDATLGLLQILNNNRDFEGAAALATDFLTRSESIHIQMLSAYFSAMSQDITSAKDKVRNIDDEYQRVPYMRGVKARIGLLEGRGMHFVDDAQAAYNAAKTADNLMLYVQTLDSAGKTNQAFPVIEQHVNDFPTDARSKALFALRQIAVDPSAALASYEALLVEFPNTPSFLNNAAYLHLQAGNNEKAFTYSSKAFELEPTDVNFADTHAQVLLKRGETQKAIEAYNMAFTDEISSESIILNYIEALFKNNDRSAATRRIEQLKFRLKRQSSKDRLLSLQAQYLN